MFSQELWGLESWNLDKVGKRLVNMSIWVNTDWLVDWNIGGQIGFCKPVSTCTYSFLLV